MSLQFADTIAALASAAGSAERGIVRVSGEQSHSLLSTIFVPDDRTVWESCRLPTCHPGRMRISQFRNPLNVALYLWPTRRSYTGQPMAEIHTVGSPPLLEAILFDLYQLGMRAASPGEFTLRAFLAGRLDLLQAEAVLGVIDAADESRLQLALEQLAGGISRPLLATRNDLLNLLADLEAGLDFIEEDIEFVAKPDVIRRLQTAGETVEKLLRQTDQRMQSDGRMQVVLAGLPNAGKSTLFNALCEKEAAIVSEIEGTTRDYLRVDVESDGRTFELIDTAGWESVGDGDVVAAAAQALRADRCQRAHLILWCTPSDFAAETAAGDEKLYQSLIIAERPVMRVTTKSDLIGNANATTEIAVSACSGRGVSALKTAISARLSRRDAATSHLLGTTAARCRSSLEATATAVQNATDAASAGWGDELVATELRDALDHLGVMVGAIYNDDILDRVFSKFCIGK